MDCLFCKIIRGEIPCYKVWEDGEAIAFLDISPVAPGHILVVPKEHHEDIYLIPEPLYASLFAKVKMVAEKLRSATGAKRIGLIVEGFGVNHVHIHLVPINGPHELDPSKAERASDEELRNMAEKLAYFL